MSDRLKVYVMLSDVPIDLAIPSVWRQRGYKVPERSKPVAWLLLELRGKVERMPLYDYGQVIWLQGRKAEIRRGDYITRLYREDER